MRSFIMITMLSMLMIPFPLAGQDKLEPYLLMAAENNPGLQASFNEYMAALEQVPQAGSLPDPQLMFSYFISPIETRMGPQQLRLSLSQFFPWFGTLGAREDAAAQTAKARYEDFQEEKSKLFSDVKKVYYELYIYRKSIDISAENIDLLATIRDLAGLKVQTGQASRVDEYRVEMEINELSDQLALLRDQYMVLELDLLNMLNADGQMSIELPDELWDTDFPLGREAALDSVMTANHSLLRLEFKQAELLYKKESARLAGRPGFNIGIDYALIGKGDNNLPGRDAFIFPVVGISIPLYRSKYKAMVRQAAFLEQANMSRSENMVNSLETLFEKTWTEYRDSQRRISLNEEQSELAMKALKLLEAEYAGSGTDLEEILRMERKLL
ncbi:MAG: TolC family protein, partial [Bacteroidales bacterium]|nr:TolC family protein [Bacteroidales bacterium]